MNTHCDEYGKDNQPPPTPAEAPQHVPWAEIETGRYQPRRIRGSCLGRELG